MRVAFLTYDQMPALCADDRLALPALGARGIEVVPWVWDGPTPGPVDAVVMRSCWDYHEKTDAFFRFLDILVAQGTFLWNPAPVLRWNVDKAYLRDLDARGARVPRTLWVPRGDAPRLDDLLKEHALEEVIIKPRLSLSAVDTFRSARARASADQARFEALARRKALLVQEFLPEIEQGEISLIFFGGRFSHAVRKTPAPGDFRVQAEHGGSRQRIEPRPEWIAESERILATLPEPLLYARVDVVERAGDLFWMELELVDPELFLALDPEAPPRFAAAIEAACRPCIGAGARR
jgi:glutathione synthase/RimK-type ligase-like ATP-grasp enzyme